MNIAPIGELCETISKWNPKRDAPAEELDYIDIASVSQETKEIGRVNKVLGAEAPSRARQLVRGGDILISTVRPNLNAVAYVPDELEGATASTGFCIIRPASDKLDGRYFYHWVRTQKFISKMMMEATGQSYPAVSDKIVKASGVPLPPLKEQKRIAAILDQADELRRLRQRAIDRLGDLSQSIFYEIFSQDRCIQKNGKLDELASVFSGNGFPTKYQGSEDGKYPFYKVGDMNLPGNEIHMSACRNWISQDQADDMSVRIFPEGTIVFPKIGAAIATNKKRILSRPSCIDNNVFGLIPNGTASSEYIHTFLLGRDLMEIAQPGNPPSIRKGSVENWNIPIPVEDADIGFRSVLGKLDLIQGDLVRSSREIGNVFLSLQQRAFRGAL